MALIGRGIIAGFLASLLLSVALDPLTTIARNTNVLPPPFAWILQLFVGGFIWGAGFALVSPVLRGPYWLRGLLFGFAAWAVLMMAMMPLTHGSRFGLKLGVATLGAMLIVHLVHGTLLGVLFRALGPVRELGRETEHDAHDDLLHPIHR